MDDVDDAKFIISIHALVKRATVFCLFANGLSLDFNPRPREEGDRGLRKSKKERRYFNPRPREEGDFGIIKKN